MPNWKVLGEKKKKPKLTSHNHTVSTNVSQRIHTQTHNDLHDIKSAHVPRAQTVGVVRGALFCYATKTITAKKKKQRWWMWRWTKRKKTAGKSESVPAMSSCRGQSLTLNLSWGVISVKDCTFCWCIPRSLPPLCRCHGDGARVATVSPWQLKACWQEEEKQAHTDLSRLSRGSGHKNTDYLKYILVIIFYLICAVIRCF